nr:reverse transcriptase domain-containing protein [Tanacetum cinerariifolium]
NLFTPLDNPELTIQRRSRTDPTLSNNSEMAAEGNGDLPATNFGLRNDMIQQVQNSCQFHGLPGDDANKHLDKFLHVTQSIKVNGVTDDALRFKYFPPSMVTKLRNEITNFYQRPNESLFEAWERYNLSIDRCPNHNMLPITKIDTFYNGLTLRHRDTINAAAGGTFMKRRPEECYDLIENMTTHHNDWDTSAQRSNIITNPKEDLKGITTRSGNAYQGPTIPTTYFLPPVVERETEVTKDTVHPTNNGSTEDVQPPVVKTESPILNSEPVINPIIEPAFSNLNFKISFADALILMPKFGPTIKTLLTKKDKLCELARTSWNEHCSAVLLKKLPEKLGDSDKFLIPCDFPGMAECLALVDLDASINLIPLSMWNKLSLPNFSPTCMTPELADRLIFRPVRVAEDVFVKVGTFHFPADFVVVDFDADP